MEEIKVEDKVFKVNEKAINDSVTFFDKLSVESVKEKLQIIKEWTEEDLKEWSFASFPEGKKLWLEITVEDAYMSMFLFRWLYSEKTTLMGSTLHSIHFSVPSELTEQEKAVLLSICQKLAQK